MGDSDKLVDSGDHSYRFVEHRRYLDAFLEAVGVGERVTLVLHDWGSALGFDWAYRHASAVRGIAYMEAFVAAITSWSDWPEQAVATFQAIRSPAGEEMVLDHNSSSRKSCRTRSCAVCPSLRWPRTGVRTWSPASRGGRR